MYIPNKQAEVSLNMSCFSQIRPVWSSKLYTLLYRLSVYKDFRQFGLHYTREQHMQYNIQCTQSQSSETLSESLSSWATIASSCTMLEHPCSLHTTVHFNPFSMQEQSDGRHVLLHVHEMRFKTTSGAGRRHLEPSIGLWANRHHRVPSHVLLMMLGHLAGFQGCVAR